MTNKKYLNKYFLFYERTQHLTFLFKKNITYENDIQNEIKKYVNTGDFVLDIGANIGQFTLFFRDIITESGKLISFEPDPNNFKFLQMNVSENRFKNVYTKNVGVGNSNRMLNFYSDKNTGGRMGTFVKNLAVDINSKSDNKINIVTLDSIIEQNGVPSFIKIDVEGFESNVLEGYKKNYNQIIFFIEVRTETKKDVFSFFNNLNYKCILLTRVNRVIGFHEEIPNFANLLFIPKKNE